MKFNLLLFTLALYTTTFAQKKETFYDFSWEETQPENATYYSVKVKTDSGWLQTDYYISTKKLQMSALYSDEACDIHNGHAHYFYANGIPSAIGRMINNKQEGICLSYHSNGMMSDSALFKNGAVVDKRFQWHPNGMMSDSISRINDSIYVHVGWFDGKANIKGGREAWSKYLEKNLDWPEGLEFTLPATVTVGVSFWIDENGQVTDAEVYVPFHPAFDKIALKTITNSPKWQPAIFHNRAIKVQMFQPVAFSQPE